MCRGWMSPNVRNEMDGRKDQELQWLSRAHLDRRWEDDMAWLGVSGNVPLESGKPGARLVAKFEKNPMACSFVVMVFGAAAFFLVILLLT